MGGEALVAGTHGEGLGGEVDPDAMASLCELSATFPGTSFFEEGGEGENSFFLGGCSSPPLCLGLDGAGGANEATTGAPQGDGWDQNGHTFGLSVGPDAPAGPLGLPSPPMKWGSADPVVDLLDDLDTLLAKEIGGTGAVDNPPAGKDSVDGFTPGTDSAASPPAPPPNDKPEGGSTRNKKSKVPRRGKGGKKKAGCGKKRTLSVPRKSPRALPSNPRAYWNAPISTIETVSKQQDEAEAMVKRQADQLRRCAEEAARRAQQFSDLIDEQRREIRTATGTWWAPGRSAEE